MFWRYLAAAAGKFRRKHDDSTPLPFAPLQAQTRIASEEKTLSKRMEGLNVILSGTTANLTTYVASFEAANVAGDDPSGSASQAGRTCVGCAPPTATLSDLCILAELDTMSKDYQDAEDAEHIKSVSKKIVARRKPARDLQSAVVAATKDLKSAMEMIISPKKPLKGKSKGKGKEKAGTGATPPKKAPVEVRP